MKPFDLEAAKRGEPIITRNGIPAKFVAYTPEGPIQRVIAVVHDVVMHYSDDGRFQLGGKGSEYDLHMPSTTKWINIYYDNFGADISPWDGVISIWDSEERADAGASSDRVGGKAHRIEV